MKFDPLKFTVGVLVGIMIIAWCNTLLADELHESVRQYHRPLVCTFIEKDGRPIVVLPWAALKEINKGKLVFELRGRTYRVPSKNYVCTLQRSQTVDKEGS